MMSTTLHPELPLIQDADLEGKVVLVRFDHNVVKGGEIRDPYRIDRTIGTLFHIVERGGRPIMMTQVGRPKDKKTGTITCRPEESVEPVVRYLEQKLHTKFYIPKFPLDPEKGIAGIDTSINLAIRELRERRIGGIYLPNMRWFQGEEAEGELRERFALQLAGLADIYVNDAFGSWQPHASTYTITGHLPSYAGYLLQQKFGNIYLAFEEGKSGKDILTKSGVPDKWADVISKISMKIFQEKEFTIKADLEIKSYAKDGIEKIKQIIGKLNGDLAALTDKVIIATPTAIKIVKSKKAE
jgi:3-phosphoglycerate kinase